MFYGLITMDSKMVVGISKKSRNEWENKTSETNHKKIIFKKITTEPNWNGNRLLALRQGTSKDTTNKSNREKLMRYR